MLCLKNRNTMSLDPDPEFRPNLVQDPRVIEKKGKLVLEEPKNLS